MTSHVHGTYSPLPHHIGTRSIALQSLLGYLFVPSDAKASRPHVWRFSPLLKENKFLQKCGVSSLILVDFINFQFFSPSFVITVNFPSEVSGNFEQQHIESSVESTAIFNFFYYSSDSTPFYTRSPLLSFFQNHLLLIFRFFKF